MASWDVPANLKMHPVWLFFVDRASEKEFSLLYQEESLLVIRVWIVIIFMIWAGAHILVRFFYPFMFRQYLVAGIVCSFWVLIAFFVATFQKRLLGWFQVMGAVENIMAAFLIVYAGILNHEWGVVALAITMPLIFGTFLLRIGFVMCLITSITYVGVYNYFLLESGFPTPPQAIFYSYLVFTIMIVTIFASFVDEKQVRTNFVQGKIIEAHHREKLAHAEKLAAMGTLVAGVAHEINNPNGSMLLDAKNENKLWDLVLPILDEKQKAEGDFEMNEYRYSELRNEISQINPRIERNAQRIGKLVENLRMLSRKEMDVFDNVSINNVVRSALSVIDYRIKRYTQRLYDTYGDNIPLIRGNPNYLEQVIINLVTNACQALPDPEKRVYVSTAHDAQKNHVVLIVRDEGRGMDKETIQHIFDPFFTTKDQKEGTGLGLSLCHNIVRNHNGDIEVESKPGAGTTIRVLLPVVPHTTAVGAGAPSPAVKP
jgi:signal transduction histidine kinase